MIVARRYAKALYEVSERQSRTDAVDRDVDFIRASLEGSRELVEFFRSPIISREKKKAIVRELFAERVDAITMRFLELLIDKEREDIFPDVVAAYRAMRDEHLNIVEASVRVAEPLGKEAQAELRDALGKLTGKNVRLRVEEDSRLIGGVVTRIGDTVYDGSVLHQLERLRETMETGSYVLN